MEYYSLFPTCVGKFVYDQITEKEINYVKKLDYQKNSGNSISDTRSVLENAPLKKIKKFCLDSVSQYFKGVYFPDEQLKPYIGISWTNITTKGQWHHKHAHPNSFVSGVFYLQCTDDDKIYFYKNNYDLLKITPSEYNVFNSDSWWLPANTGILYLFPSHLTHSVSTVEHDTPRISLSFNTWLRGPIGLSNQADFLQLP